MTVSEERDEAPNGFSRETDAMPEDELLYDLADLFKVFSDTTRIKICLLYTSRCV